MGRYNFKGDLGDASDRQLDYIGEVLEQRGIKGPDILVEPVGAAGDNFVANVKRLTVNANGTLKKMIVKFASKNPTARMSTNTGLCFRNEHIVYTELLPKFRQLQVGAALEGEDLYRFPECYGSLSEEPNELIILEDLKEIEFTMMDKSQSLNLECIQSVLKNFAKFHALSFVLKHQDPETYSAIKDKLQLFYSGSLFCNEVTIQYYKQLEQFASKIVHKNEHKNALKGSVGDMYNLVLKCTKAQKDSRHSVIIQGDGWTNNIMFKMENDKPLASVIIDYQLATESSPMYDIMYFLFNSTDHEQRHQYYYEFIDYYYNELVKASNNLGLNVLLSYTRDQLDADLKRFGKYLLGVSLLISSVIIRNNDDAAKVKESFKDDSLEDRAKNALDIDPETMKVYKKRIEDLAESFVEFGLA